MTSETRCKIDVQCKQQLLQGEKLVFNTIRLSLSYIDIAKSKTVFRSAINSFIQHVLCSLENSQS